MPEYSPPSLDNVNFELELYSIPALDAVDSELSGTSLVSNKIECEWKNVASDSRNVEWKNVASDSRNVEWKNVASDSRNVEWSTSVSDTEGIAWKDLISDLNNTEWKNIVYELRNIAYSISTSSNQVQIEWSTSVSDSRNVEWKDLISDSRNVEWKDLISDLNNSVLFKTEWKNIVYELRNVEWKDLVYNFQTINQGIAALSSSKSISWMDLVYNIENISWLLFGGCFLDLKWTVPQIISQAVSKTEVPFLFYSDIRNSDWIIWDGLSTQSNWIVWNDSIAQSKWIIWDGLSTQSKWIIWDGLSTQSNWIVWNDSIAQSKWIIWDEAVIDIKYLLQSIMTQADSGIELSRLFLSDYNDISWYVINDKFSDVNWGILTLQELLSLTLDWKIKTLEERNLDWIIYTRRILLNSAWRNLNVSNFHLHYGVELPDPVKKFFAKNRNFVYNVDVKKFLYVSDDESFIKYIN